MCIGWNFLSIFQTWLSRKGETNNCNQIKIWSSHLLDNLSNCLMNLKNSSDSTGFELMTFAMPVQCSNQLSYEVTHLREGQFVGLVFSRERNVVWKKCYMKCGVLKSNEDMILALAGQFKQLSHEPEKFRWLNGIRTRHWVTWIFQVHETIAYTNNCVIRIIVLSFCDDK